MASEAVGHASLSEKIHDKIHEYEGSSSSSDSENESPLVHEVRKKRLFGRKEPVHSVFGGGKSADIILWRNKQMSGCILTGVTVLWLLFEWVGYHLLTFLCHSLIFSLGTIFLLSNAASFLSRDPPKFPEVTVPEELYLRAVHAVGFHINDAFACFRFVATKNDLKTLLMAIGGLWILSIVGSLFSFLTLFYILILGICTLPALYEKYEDHVDSTAERAIAAFDEKYAALHQKVLRKLPRSLSQIKRH